MERPARCSLASGFTTARRKRRGQAAAVTVGKREDFVIGGANSIRRFKEHRYFIRNDSPLPIFQVLLYAGPADDRSREWQEVLSPGDQASFVMPTSDFMAFAKFVDSAGVAWKRDASGNLTEIKSNDGVPWSAD